jgi:chitodextrinase
MTWRLLPVIASLVTVANMARGQTMEAVTTPAGPGLKVVLTWPSTSPTQRYNLYRKLPAAATYPATPLNATPLERPSSCAAIQVVIPPASSEWQLIVNGLDPAGPFDPCQISTLAATSSQEARLQFLARTRWKIAVAAGQGYVDTNVTNGTSYEYELRAVDPFGSETGVLFTNVGVKAGAPKLIAAPGGLAATAGDSRVLLLWGDEPEAAGFVVFRSTAPGGPYVRVNEADFLTRIKQDLDGKALPAESNGFLDIQRWASDGTPTTHVVNGVNVGGPSNGVTYHYKIASLDLVGQQGPLSVVAVAATPADKTPPMAPNGLSITPIDSQNRLEVRWNVANLDTDGHVESAPIAGYRLYRYESENTPLGSGTQIGAVIPSPPAGQTFITASDNDPILRPQFGEKTFWYRVEATDASGNVGARSAAIGGHLKDITPPAPPKGIAAEGFDDFIVVRWNANTEPDVDGYLIYRTLCHYGVANPCDPRPPRSHEPEHEQTGLSFTEPGKSDQIPCTGEYVLIGSVSAADAMAMGNIISFNDHTVPAGSPLCYSYWVKAYDQAQNKSGSWPVPDAAHETTVCQRLRDRTPPDPAIISALLARDKAIQVEWVGPPVQDIRAYHVYRSDTQTGTYKWVGGMTVEPPPAPPHVLSAPYTAPSLVGCDEIPLIAIDSMSIGSFLDNHVDAKAIYWYKVVGIDQSGNEAPLNKAAPVSTFTFTTRQPPAPTITSVTGTTAAPWALVVRWTPAFDPAQERGFAVFRSDKVDGLYRQRSTLLMKAEYQDDQVVRNATYWYKVVVMDKTGQVSQVSAAVSGTLP